LKFSDLTKKIDSLETELSNIELKHIKAQYNPERFKYWKSLYVCSDNDFLNMSESPHCRLLRRYEKHGDNIWKNIHKTPYYKMHEKYGKKHEWTLSKTKKFVNIFNEIKIKREFKEPPVILQKPLVKNIHNNSYEIFEGHHRVACSIVCNFVTINCLLVRN